MPKSVSPAFFGSSDNSLVVLRTLKNAGFDIKLVISAPPRPVGRKQILTETPPHVFALENGIPVLAPEKLDDKFTEELKKVPVDVCVVADFARLIPKEVLDFPKNGCLNLHPSLLPKYRGSSPAEMAILHGEQQTGMTIIKMDEQFDHGPIVSQFNEEIRDTDTSETLYRRLFTAGAQVLTTILPAWVDGRIVPREQDHLKATLAPRLTRDDGFIPWSLIQTARRGETMKSIQLNALLDQAQIKQRSGKFNKFSPGATARPKAWQAFQSKTKHQSHALATKKISVELASPIERAIRAFHPWPGIWTRIEVRRQKSGDRKMRLKILSAHLDPKPLPAQAGYPLTPTLVLDSVQLEGKQPTEFTQLKPSPA